MSDTRIAGIIQMLEHVRERPAMFARSKTSQDVGTFLSGFACGCHVLGLPLGYQVRMAVTEERGWPPSAEVWSLSAMREKGLSEEAIVDEMLAIEIAAWQRLAESLNPASDAS